jgi:BirA family biotin operon repressor/biotin-[acetyl-CoA-carboxylase] ligase
LANPRHDAHGSPVLSPAIDPPFPWRLRGREKLLHFFRETTSTMDEARRLAREGCPSFSVAVAETQTKGRGRLMRHWHSQAGGLYFTIVLRPDLPPADCFKLNFLASVCLARLLRHRCGIDAEIKWPNDILVNQLKLVGILSESGIMSNRVDYVNIGIGINVNNPPPETTPEATSIKHLIGKPLPRPALLADFLDEFEAGVRGVDGIDIISEWKQYGISFGRPVTVASTGGEFRGVTEDIDAEGALLLRLPDGSLKRILYGDCFV